MEVNYTKKYINSLYSFGTRKEWKESIVVPIHKKIEWTVIIIEEFHYCLLHIKFFRTYFYRE